MKTCKNCGHTADGIYCSNCGQSLNIHEINFRFVIHEIQHSLFHVDKGILYTFKELCCRPGYAIKEYIDGKRIRYFKPVVFVLILSTVYSLLEYSVDRVAFLEDFLAGAVHGYSKDMTPGEKASSMFVSFVSWLISHYAYTVLLMIPLISLASYLAFKKYKHNYFHHVVLNAYTAGQITFFYIVLFMLTYFVPEQYMELGDVIKVILGILYAGWTYFQFFDGKSVLSRPIPYGISLKGYSVRYGPLSCLY